MSLRGRDNVILFFTRVLHKAMIERSRKKIDASHRYKSSVNMNFDNIVSVDLEGKKGGRTHAMEKT